MHDKIISDYIFMGNKNIVNCREEDNSEKDTQNWGAKECKCETASGIYWGIKRKHAWIP